MTEAETTHPVRLAMRQVNPSAVMNDIPRVQAAPAGVVHTLVTGSRYCRTRYDPIVIHQSPAGRTNTSPGERASRLVEMSAGAFVSCVGKRFCGSGSPWPGPARGIGILAPYFKDLGLEGST